MLVVDDHDVVHWGFRLMLTQQPWVERCVSAHTGAEAVALAARYRPHVALVDLFIGEESGAEVCERLREAEPSLARAAVLGRRRDLAARRARRRRVGVRLQGLAGAQDRRARCGSSAWARPCSSRQTARARWGCPTASARCSTLMASGATNPEIAEAAAPVQAHRQGAHERACTASSGCATAPRRSSAASGSGCWRSLVTALPTSSDRQ